MEGIQTWARSKVTRGATVQAQRCAGWLGESGSGWKELGHRAGGEEGAAPNPEKLQPGSELLRPVPRVNRCGFWDGVGGYNEQVRG